MNLLSPGSLGEQIYRNKLITVCLLLSWLGTKGEERSTKYFQNIFESINEKKVNFYCPFSQSLGAKVTLSCGCNENHLGSFAKILTLRLYATPMKSGSFQAREEGRLWWGRGSYLYKNIPKSSWCAARNAKHWMRECIAKKAWKNQLLFSAKFSSRACCSMMTAIQKRVKTRKCFPMISDFSYLSPNVSTSLVSVEKAREGFLQNGMCPFVFRVLYRLC